MKLKLLHKLSLAGALALSLVACGGGDNGTPVRPPVETTPPPTETTPPPPPPTETAFTCPVSADMGTICGQVTSAIDSSPIEGATVTLGSASVSTDANGMYVLTGVAPSSFAMLRVSAANYGPWPQETSATAGQVSTVNVQLSPVGGSFTGSAANPITVNVSNSPAGVDLPADSLVRADGGAIQGDVTVTATSVAPGINVNAMPGQYRVDTGGGAEGLMESWGAINVTLTDSTGARLDLAPGKTATVRIEVSTRSATVPATIPLFYFDETVGLWKQEGQATLDASGRFYAGQVAHFTYWNADQIMETIYVNGCVNDELGSPVVGARVIVDGIDYSNASSALTGTDGKFSVPMKKNALGALIAQRGTRLSNTLSIQSLSGDYALNQCLTLAATNAISIKLTWGERPLDVDSYLLAPDGSMIYYFDKGSLTQAPFASLDVDDTSSYGPEVVTLTRLMVGTYTYVVNNYSETYNPGLTGSPVRVELNRGGPVTAFSPPAGEVNGSTMTWNVFNLTVDSQCGVTVTPVNTWSADWPEPSASTTPQYCTPQ
jgi:hypothetical protein